MLPIVGVPETIRRGMAPYRDVFCRDAGFQVSALQADFSDPSHAWLASNLALKAVRSARAVSWAVAHPRSLQRLGEYLGGDHNAHA